jgi:CubicO group peptidase (beta-lactamase class C family)
LPSHPLFSQLTLGKGYGIATFPNTPVTPSTLFNAGSTSKAHTTALLAHIIDSGNFTTDLGTPLSWSSPISSVLRNDFVLQDEWATHHLTLADAASHRTGMPRHDKSTIHAYYDESGERQRLATVRDVVRAMRYLPMTAEPRTKWQYCNLMYVALAHVIETLFGGRWMGNVLRETLWAPLGMNSTYFSLEEALAAPEHLAQGYYWDEAIRSDDGEEGQFMPIPFWEADELDGAGGVISSVNDYTRWIRFWIDEAAPMSKTAHKAVKAPLMIEGLDAGMFDAPTAYAAGWTTGSYRSHRFWYRNGGTDAYGTELWVFPELQFGAVTMGNTAVGANAVGTALLGQLIDDKLGVLDHERKDWNQPCVLPWPATIY